MMECAKEF